MSLAHREKLLVSGKRIDFSGSCDRIHCCGFCSVAVIAKSNQVMWEMSMLAYIFRSCRRIRIRGWTGRQALLLAQTAFSG